MLERAILNENILSSFSYIGPKPVSNILMIKFNIVSSSEAYSIDILVESNVLPFISGLSLRRTLGSLQWDRYATIKKDL